MSIRFLRSLIAIATHGSFAGAADSVHLSHSALSMQMRSLEDQLQTQLFDRTTRPPSLNPQGRALVDHARKVVELYDQMFGIISDPVALSGTLALGTIPTVSTGLLPPALSQLRARYENLQMRISIEMSDHLVDKVIRNDLDCAIIVRGGELPSELTWLPIAEEPFCVLKRHQEKFTDIRQLLETLPYIRFSNRFRTDLIIERYLRDNGIMVKPFAEFGSLEGISVMVYYGLGVAIVPKRIIGYPVLTPLDQILLPEPAPKRELGLVFKPGHPRMDLIKAFVSEIHSLVMSASLPAITSQTRSNEITVWGGAV